MTLFDLTPLNTQLSADNTGIAKAGIFSSLKGKLQEIENLLDSFDSEIHTPELQCGNINSLIEETSVLRSHAECSNIAEEVRDAISSMRSDFEDFQTAVEEMIYEIKEELKEAEEVIERGAPISDTAVIEIETNSLYDEYRIIEALKSIGTRYTA